MPSHYNKLRKKDTPPVVPKRERKEFSTLNANRDKTKAAARKQVDSNIAATKARNKAARIAANRAKTLAKQKQLDALNRQNDTQTSPNTLKGN